MCIEGGAELDGDFIHPMVFRWAVVSWTSTQIALEPVVDACGSAQITVDLVAGRFFRTYRLKRTSPSCDALKGLPDVYTLELVGDH
jgi:hypothetical protein